MSSSGGMPVNTAPVSPVGTKGETLPEELQRQSRRINEQLVQLGALLDIITERLEDMIKIMSNYSPELVGQFKVLKESLESYKSKTNRIYGDISKGLLAYSTRLLHYLDELANNVAAIGTAVKDL